MMPMTGTIYLTDSKELVAAGITDPRKIQRCMVLDMDEQSKELEEIFKDDCVKATLLLPPTTAVFRLIDGDNDGFVQEYIEYLNMPVVEEYLAALILMVHHGINTFLYIPEFSEDSVWVNILLKFLQDKYGFHVGTSQTDGFIYNHMYDAQNACMMYQYGCFDVIYFMKILPPDFNGPLPQPILGKLYRDMEPVTGQYENPIDAFNRYRAALYENPNVKPALLFE